MTTTELLASLAWTVPEISLAFAATVILAIEALTPPATRRRTEPVIALAAVLIAFATNLAMHSQRDVVGMLDAYGGMIRVDGVTGFLRGTILAALFLGYLFALRGQIWTAIRSEYYSLTLFAAMGAILMVQAQHLLVLIMGLEILSLPLYTLAALRKSSARSQEAGLKYFILGSLASAFMIYGAALLYGACGSVYYDALFPLNYGDDSLYEAGALFVLAGLLFKGGLMPFYVWSPDVYEGAPDAMVGLMAALAKVGAFGALIRLIVPLAGALPYGLTTPLAIVAALTMLAGNLLALAQTNLKRLLAYSSVAHAGYLLLGVLSLTDADSAQLGLSALLFYFGTYLVTLIAAFALIAFLEGKREGSWDLHDLRGFAQAHPAPAFLLAALLFSLAGIPPLAGFFGKAYVFHAAIGAGYTGLAMFGILTSLMSVYYYLRPIVAMYFETSERPLGFRGALPGAHLAGQLIVWFLIVVGVIPVLLYTPAYRAARGSLTPAEVPLLSTQRSAQAREALERLKLPTQEELDRLQAEASSHVP